MTYEAVNSISTERSYDTADEAERVADLGAGSRVRNIHIELLSLLKPDLQAGRFQAPATL